MARGAGRGAGRAATGIIHDLAEPLMREADDVAGRVARTAERDAAETAGRDAAGRTARDLPAGYTRDPTNGRVRGPDGRYATDPHAEPRQHTRDTEYPGGYRQSTHDDLATRYTDEGQAAGGVPVDASGNRIPRDQLTWRDEQGRVIPPDQLTYEHRTPVVEHWNTEGYNTAREARNDWYNNTDNLVPMTRRENSSGGGLMTERYRQDTGGGYSR